MYMCRKETCIIIYGRYMEVEEYNIYICMLICMPIYCVYASYIYVIY